MRVHCPLTHVHWNHCRALNNFQQLLQRKNNLLVKSLKLAFLLRGESYHSCSTTALVFGGGQAPDKAIGRANNRLLLRP